MLSDRQQRPPPRERTFAEVFPWRNIVRAVMLLLLIVAIVVIKRSSGRFLERVGELWAPAAPSSFSAGPSSPARSPAPSPERRIRLGPGLAPAPAPPAPEPPAQPRPR